MNLSDFNYYFDTDRGLMLFNSLHEKISIIKTSIRANTVLSDSSALVDYLAEKGLYFFLQDSDQRECMDVVIKKKVAARLRNDYLYLKILTTYNCNMACIYCYENNAFFSRNNISISLGEEKCDEIITFASSIMNKKKLKYIYLSWYGGEPLLNYQAILNISKRLIAMGYKVYSEITSNLLPLRTKLSLIDELKSVNVKMFAVTLDGHGIYHNSRRPIKNRKQIINEYEETCNLISLLSMDFKVTVMLMINKENIKQADMILQDLLSVKNKANVIIFIGMLENISNCLSDICKGETISFSDLANIRCLLYKKFWDAGFPVNLKFLLGMHGTCLALMNNSYVITPENYLTKCPDTIGNTKLYTGLLKKNKEIKFNNSLWTWELPFKDKKCSVCHLLPACVGGCNYTYITQRYHNCQFYSSDGINIQNKEAMQFALQNFVLNRLAGKYA